MLHAGNTIYVLLDLLVSETPLRIYHTFHCMLYGICYIAFSAVYQYLGGTNSLNEPYIYSSLDWKNVSRTIIISVIVIFVLMPLMWFVLWCFSKLKLLCRSQNKKQLEWNIALDDETQTDQVLYIPGKLTHSSSSEAILLKSNSIP